MCRDKDWSTKPTDESDDVGVRNEEGRSEGESEDARVRMLAAASSQKLRWSTSTLAEMQMAPHGGVGSRGFVLPSACTLHLDYHAINALIYGASFRGAMNACSWVNSLGRRRDRRKEALRKREGGRREAEYVYMPRARQVG